ncbi:MAG: hypothetical protein LBG65_02375 [Puniceicoccales bacterium]|jgi:hypothetical protein|nr:hypothetical protein [Puniceicoccales bacterium]
MSKPRPRIPNGFAKGNFLFLRRPEKESSLSPGALASEKFLLFLSRTLPVLFVFLGVIFASGTQDKDAGRTLLDSLASLSEKWENEHPERHVRLTSIVSGQTHIVEVLRLREGASLRTCYNCSMVSESKRIRFYMVEDLPGKRFLAYFPRSRATVKFADHVQFEAMASRFSPRTGVLALAAVSQKTRASKNEKGYLLSAELDVAKLKDSGVFPVGVNSFEIISRFSETGRLESMEQVMNGVKSKTKIEYLSFDSTRIREEMGRFPEMRAVDQTKSFADAMAEELSKSPEAKGE